MRIDKFLKNSRLIKRRTVAKEACDAGRISINDRICKAGTEVEVGDRIHIAFGNSTLDVKVLAVLDTVRKEDAATMYEVLDGPVDSSI